MKNLNTKRNTERDMKLLQINDGRNIDFNFAQIFMTVKKIGQK